MASSYEKNYVMHMFNASFMVDYKFICLNKKNVVELSVGDS